MAKWKRKIRKRKEKKWKHCKHTSMHSCTDTRACIERCSLTDSPTDKHMEIVSSIVAILSPFFKKVNVTRELIFFDSHLAVRELVGGCPPSGSRRPLYRLTGLQEEHQLTSATIRLQPCKSSISALYPASFFSLTFVLSSWWLWVEGNVRGVPLLTELHVSAISPAPGSV